jgi:hypothetical protein
LLEKINIDNSAWLNSAFNEFYRFDWCGISFG